MTGSGTPETPEGRAAVLALLRRPSGWGRLRMFSSSAHAPRVRRREDLITLTCAVLALLAVMPAARTTDGIEAALLDTINQIPSFSDPVLAFAYDLLGVFAVVVVGVALVRRHWRLLVGAVLSIPAAIGLTLAVDARLGLDTSRHDLHLGAPVEGIPVQLVLALALTSLVAREMSRPFRTAGRRLMALGVVGAVLLPVTSPYRVLCAVLMAHAVASAVRLVIGSPVTTVSAADVGRDLADLSVDAIPSVDWDLGRREATTADGRRWAVRVLGRDEWDQRAAATMWRFLWYRNSGAHRWIAPRQEVEHEAFLLMLAASRGVAVTPVAAAGMSQTGDALVATEIVGRGFDHLAPEEIDDGLLDRCWAALEDLHRAGIAHGAIDAGSLRIDDERLVLASFEDAELLDDANQVHADRAQLLVVTALATDNDRAVAAALRALDATEEEAMAALLSYLQKAAFDPDLRREVNESDLDLDDLRAAVAERASIEVPKLQKIQRVTWATFARLGLLVFVAYLLISQLADVGWDAISEAIREASPAILLAALIFGQVPRVAQAASLQAASPVPVPLSRLTRLQFAVTFVNLAVPATAARVAVHVRFFQRSGATPAIALSAGALDSFAGFCSQVVLVGTVFLAGWGTFGDVDVSGAPQHDGDIVKVVLIVIGLALVAGLVLLLAPKLRARAKELAGQLREAASVLRSPGKLVRMFLCNVLASLLFATTMAIVMKAFGQHVSFADLVVVNEAAGFIAGIMPVPGGVGVSEAALAAGLGAAGVPEATAFSAAICYRLCTFYLPPLWGYGALRSLRKDGYL
jgi:uncharacterized membrane protein YbhN (UPF0104 family)